MKKVSVESASGFQVLTGDQNSQAASMVIPTGGREGGPDNAHKGADQWLYVQEGSAEAIVNGRSHTLEAGDLILIARGEKHEVRNTGSAPLRTLNIYVPPAYTAEGEELPAGSSK